MARILVIDDDAALAKSIARALERVGHVARVAKDGAHAVRLFEREPYDLLITDVLMPEMDGYEVIRSFRRRTPTVPVIAMSGGGEWPRETLLETASYVGAVESISKPFELAALLHAVDRALGGSGGAPQPPQPPS